MKYLALFAINCLIIVSKPARAQEFKLLAFDGSNQKIDLNYDEAHELLKLSLLKDTLWVHRVSYLDTITTLNSQFLLVYYGIRGGSGIHVKRALVICVKNDKLYKSLDITSLFNEEFIDFSKKVDTSNPVDRKTVYECKLSISGNNANDYSLNVTVHLGKQLKQSPSQNSDTNQTFKLNFDPVKNVFFSTMQEISQYFKVFNETTLGESKRYFLGKLPMISLGGYKYYYANDVWYEQSQSDHLIDYTYH